MGLGATLGLLSRVAALTLALGAALTASASAAGAAVQMPQGAPGAQARGLVEAGSWASAWSWPSGSRGLPNGCAPYSVRTSAGMRWSPSLVRVVGGRLRLATSGGRAGNDLAGSGIGCSGLAQRYARVKVRARMPQGAGLVGRIALWPSTPGRGSDWSGLTVPSVDLGPAYATNGSGDEARGAEIPARLAGAFHDYLITWSPEGLSVAVDGRTVYQDSQSFDLPRWVGISLSATGPSTARASLVVENVVAESWTGPVTTRTPASATVPTTTPTMTPTTALATAQRDSLTTRSWTGSATSPGDAGATASARGRQVFQGPQSPLQNPATPAMIALGVLLGIVRAARAARQRRPLNPR